MKKITRTVEIKAPVQRVYDFLTQPENLPSIWPNMVSVSNVTVAANGSHDFDWIYKMAGLHFKGHAETLEAVPGKLVRMRNQRGIPSTFVWTYEGLNGSGTRLTVAVEYEIPTPIIGKIAEALLVKLNERDCENLLANLKDAMEHGLTSAIAAHP